MTQSQKSLIQEILMRFNDRRRLKRRPTLRAGSLPPVPGPRVTDFYLVDTYQVRRHWRRRPSLNLA